MTEPNELSERELEVLELLATGASNKEIAQKLFISTNTVKVHLRNIFSKIGVASRTEAAIYAVNLGLIPASAQADQVAFEQDSGNEIALQGLQSLPSGASKSRRTAVLIGLAAFIGIILIFFLFINPRLLDQASSEINLVQEETRWLVMPALPTARFGLALAAYEDMIFAVGGETDSGVTSLVEGFNIGDSEWISLASKATPVSDIQGVVIGGKLYIPGGRLNSGGVTDVLEIYDPRMDKWSNGASLPQALSAYSLVAYEGKMYLFGGWDGVRYVATVYEYDPTENRWFQKSPMNYARGYSGAALSGGKIYVLGGYDGQNALTQTEVYAPDQDKGNGGAWSSGTPLPSGRYGMGVTSIADIIQILGGIDEQGNALPALEYFPQSESWQEFAGIDQDGWSFLGVVPVGTQLVAIGGKLNGKPSDQHLSYQAVYILNIPAVIK